MPSYNITQLFTVLSVDDIKESILDTCEALGLPARSWQSGGIARTLVAVMSEQVAKFTVLLPEMAKAGFLEYASGTWLTILAKNVYNVERDEAQAATGTITLTNSTGSSHVIAIGDLHFANPTSGATYTNTSAGTIPANDTFTFDITADVVGSGGSSSAGTITEMVTPILGVTCSNGDALSGADEESDDDLRARCYESMGALSPNGPSDAYDFIAKSTTVDINRTSVVSDLVTGNVTVYVAKPSAAAVTAPELAILEAAIQTQCVPAGITATVVDADASAVTPTINIWYYASSNLTEAEVEALALAAVEAYFDDIRIGGDTTDGGATGFVPLDAIIAAVRSVSDKIAKVTITSPGANPAVLANEVPKLGTVTWNITEVDDP